MWAGISLWCWFTFPWWLVISSITYIHNICMSSLQKGLFRVFAQFLIAPFLRLSCWVPYIFWILTPNQIHGSLFLFSLCFWCPNQKSHHQNQVKEVFSFSSRYSHLNINIKTHNKNCSRSSYTISEIRYYMKIYR